VKQDALRSSDFISFVQDNSETRGIKDLCNNILVYWNWIPFRKSTPS